MTPHRGQAIHESQHAESDSTNPASRPQADHHEDLQAIQVSPNQAYTYTNEEWGERTTLPTAAGPAECGRAGDSQHPYLVCNVLTSAGWKSYTSTPGDWGYAWLRGWVANRDGTISYCRAVADGSSLTCDTFTGTTWKTSAWFKTDVGYSN